jgi:hypothetical protein
MKILILAVIGTSLVAGIIGLTTIRKMPVKSDLLINQPVPLPSGEDIIRSFWQLVGEKRITEAVGKLSSDLAPDDFARQTWAGQFSEMESVVIRDIIPWEEENWSLTRKQYKVELSVAMSAATKTAALPNYGWEGDPDICWIELVKNADGLWQISAIATGP